GPPADLRRTQPLRQLHRHAVAEGEAHLRSRLSSGRYIAGPGHDRLLSARGGEFDQASSGIGLGTADPRPSRRSRRAARHQERRTGSTHLPAGRLGSCEGRGASREMLGAGGERGEAAEILELAQLRHRNALRPKALLRPVGPRHLSRAVEGAVGLRLRATGAGNTVEREPQSPTPQPTDILSHQSSLTPYPHISYARFSVLAANISSGLTVRGRIFCSCANRTMVSSALRLRARPLGIGSSPTMLRRLARTCRSAGSSAAELRCLRNGDLAASKPANSRGASEGADWSSASLTPIGRVMG